MGSFANCQDFVNWNINRTSGSQIAQTSLDVAEPQHCQAQCDDMPKCRTWLYSELTAAVRKDMHPNNVGSYPTHKAVCRFFNGTGGRGGPCVNATCASGSSLGGTSRCLTVCNLLGQRHGATLSKPVDCKHNGVIDPDHGDLCRCTGCSAPWKGPRCNVCPLTVETDCKAPTDKHSPYLDTATCQCKFSCSSCLPMPHLAQRSNLKHLEQKQTAASPSAALAVYPVVRPTHQLLNWLPCQPNATRQVLCTILRQLISVTK